MKWKLGVGVLFVIAIALGLALNARNKAALNEKAEFEARVQTLSNDLRQTHEKWVDQTKVNTVLESDLSARAVQLAATSNRVDQLSNTLAKTEDEVRAASAANVAAREELAKRDERIAELEGEKDQMTRRMVELNSEITQLEGHITETQRKLTASEGDRDFLLKELKRLQAEKSELERQFNDLAILREQVKKLRDELSVARRIEWIRRGLYGSDMKGGERLSKGFPASQSRTNYDLNAEIRRDGSARIVPGAEGGGVTNTPPAPATTTVPPTPPNP